MTEQTAEHRSTADTRRDATVGITLAIVGTFLFALKSIFIKLAFAAGATPTLLLTVRMLLALPFYVLVLWYLQRSKDVQPVSQSLATRSFALGFLGYYLASYLDLSGLSYISAQLERLTLFTYPAMVAVLAWMFLGERLSGRILIAILSSYAGVGLMYGQERTFSQGTDVGLGVILVFGSALSYSLYVLFAKPTMQRIGSRQFTSLAMIGSTFFVGVHFLATQNIRDFAKLPPIVYGYGAILAFVCTVVPSFMINEAIVRIGATRTTVIGSIGPVLTMMLAIAVLDEPSSLQHFAGMAVAILGVSLVARR
ncbi:EamA-like transporter family protein [Novipirellula galeiformis]|uniref:EamA-like transporter family protein n=1 Tax=Novipirellula galeiformis TaxID=2528004 RepID=A0A5C6BZW4_9BACT|nr:DMT family transporter [Novipirellula galeiformis]TWU17247.1 EamA-like transporter family protein [Novipirellula galeiformis]